jgi:uncharacterized protein YjbI with pentapeptide repeats
MARRVHLWKIAASITLSTCFLLLILIASPVLAAPRQRQIISMNRVETPIVQTTPTEDPTVTALNKEKLEQEVEQLQNQNFWSTWTSLATPLSILAVLAGGLFGLIRYFADRQNEREKRDEDRFQKVVEGLGSAEDGMRVGAAVMLCTFLRPDYKRFYRQAFDLIVANLRRGDADQTILRELDSLNQVLITAFKEAFPFIRDRLDQEDAFFDSQSLDASHVRLNCAYLVAADLKKIWMPNTFLRKADLREADLREAILRGADLREADLSKANLSGADLSKADLRGADLSKTDLSEADLSKADLREANLHETDLSKTDLSEADLRETVLGTDLSKAYFNKAKLNEADLIRADLREAILSKADLHGADLREAILSKADLREADLREADLREAILSEAYLREAKLCLAKICKANLSGANLSGANLSGANLSGANLKIADLSGADLSGADLSGANLSGADLSGADLSGADLSEVDFRLVDLSRANLSGVDFRLVDLSRVIMINVRGVDTAQLAEYEQRGAIIQKPTASKEPLSAATTPSPSDTSSSTVPAQRNDGNLPSSSIEGTNQH